jgi:hypothetical protein
VDTLSVFDGKADYHERDGDTRLWGHVPFDQLQGRFLHLGNEPDAIGRNERIEGEFSGTLFGDAALSGTYNVRLDGSNRFQLTAQVRELDLTQLNTATGPLLRIEVNGGQLHRMHLRMEGDERRAKGDVALHYDDLKVRIEPGTPRELRHSMFGSVIETMLTEAYGGGLSADRERSYTIDRDTTKSMITYLWHALREGLARNLAPEAWGRMRSMLRQDAEQRREQRATRKAQRSGRR